MSDQTSGGGQLSAIVTRLATWTVDPIAYLEPCADDVRAILSALSHETERADLLQAAVHGRCAERDALAERVRVLEGALRDIVSPLDSLQRDADARGSKLGAKAWDIANNLHFVQSIALAALSPSPLVEGGR